MVKFSKQFEGQLVPEWKEAFVDYWQLKKDLKRMQRFVSSLLILFLGIFQVHKKLTSSGSRGVLYETELLEQFADTDAAKEFFARLDLQLNKVNQFYKGKEKEFLERGESLKKQMEILLELKAALKKQRGWASSTNDAKDDPSISCSITSEEDSTKGTADPEEQDQSQEILATELERSEFQFPDCPQGQDDPRKLVTAPSGDGKLRSLSGRVFSRQGKNLKIKIPLTTPSRTLSALTDLFREDLGSQSRKCGAQGGKLNINKTKLHHAEKMIRGAFVELYKGLGYLQTYRNLNMLAFVKILKKFDKVLIAEALMDEVEELFIEHFADDDKRKAMKYLKPHQRVESHAVTFFIGD
ncbi:hypothetical protein BHE74_00041476 [Ensete ventricosum]|nr:hypothetical protein GW17_00008243 [Ensete ventricosum]RWW52136.1 hypothetical protein BHE74_00041476 [Ensete ventricosum]RZS16247.1 hypothetical protein BHM03_00048212 [Ensete ventricosum]